MKRTLTVAFITLLTVCCLISLVPFNTFALVINPNFHVDTTPCQTLAEAFSKAEPEGSVITQDGNTTTLVNTNESIVVTKNITLKLGKDFSGTSNTINYTGTAKSLFTISKNAVLTVLCSKITGNTNSTVSKGGLFYVEKGGTLIINGTNTEPVIISNSKLKGSGALGGAIYVEQGGKVIINGVSFSDNSASSGADIYAEQKTDLTVNKDLKYNFDYGASVIIDGVNVVLSGELGLVFYTAVPEKYLEGSFKLSCRTGETVTYKIADCGKDGYDRYKAKYNLSAVQLSEPVTITVCDKAGDTITFFTTSAEQYGKTVLNDETVTEKEKKIVKAMLNYGHYAQIECAEYNGWEIGKDYYLTEKYADLTAKDTDFDEYAATHLLCNPSMSKLGIQLNLGYKTDIKIHIPSKTLPNVTVNGEQVTVYESDIKGYGYYVLINEVSALDLAKRFTINVDDISSMSFCALSYFKAAIGKNGENSINAVKALYELYVATTEYNYKPTAPEEDF